MKRKKIGKRETKQHLKFGNGNGRSATAQTIVATTIKLTANEEINASRAIHVGSDAEGYVATLTKPVIGLSKEYTPSSELVSIQTDETMTIADAAFSIGADVWLCAPDGITGLNMTTTPPTVTAGQYTQRLGRAITATSMLIEIGAAELAE